MTVRRSTQQPIPQRLAVPLAARMALWSRAMLREDWPDQARAIYALACELESVPRGSGSAVYDLMARVAGIERAEAFYLRLRGA